MRLKYVAIIGIGALVLAQLVTSFAAVDLLARMSPAIEKILNENVLSNTAMEEMLVSLATGGDMTVRTEAFRDALDHARNNITEAEERPVLDTIENEMTAALAGDPRAKQRLISALLRLSKINRFSMSRADNAAKRIGTSGAWAMVLLGLIGFFIGILVLRRLIRIVIDPMAEIRRALDARMKGETTRRITLRRAVPDLFEVAALINALLDSRTPGKHDPRHDMTRSALLHFLDQEPRPMLLMSRTQETLATNHAMERLLDSDRRDTVRAAVEAYVHAKQTPDGWSVTDLKGEAFLLASAINRD